MAHGLGIAVAVPVGFVLGWFSIARTMADPLVNFFRALPPIALIPLVILWFGIDETAKIFLVALGTLFPIYINTWHGIRNIDRGLVEMARSYGLSGWPLYRDVILPGASYAEKAGTYVNLEGRVQRGDAAVFAPGDARAWGTARPGSRRAGRARARRRRSTGG